MSEIGESTRTPLRHTTRVFPVLPTFGPDVVFHLDFVASAMITITGSGPACLGDGPEMIVTRPPTIRGSRVSPLSRQTTGPCAVPAPGVEARGDPLPIMLRMKIPPIVTPIMLRTNGQPPGSGSECAAVERVNQRGEQRPPKARALALVTDGPPGSPRPARRRSARDPAWPALNHATNAGVPSTWCCRTDTAAAAEGRDWSSFERDGSQEVGPCRGLPPQFAIRNSRSAPAGSPAIRNGTIPLLERGFSASGVV